VADAKRYRKRRDDVIAFASALRRFLDVCEGGEETFVGVMPVSPRAGQEAEAARLADEVDRLSGRAALAFAGQHFIAWQPRGTMQTVRVNPAVQWRTILDFDPRFPPSAILAVCNQAIGVLEAQAEDAEEHKQSRVEQVERGTRIAVGRPFGPTGQLRTAFLASIVGIPAALIVAYLGYLLGWG
jgi:hypothetical protein